MQVERGEDAQVRITQSFLGKEACDEVRRTGRSCATVMRTGRVGH